MSSKILPIASAINDSYLLPLMVTLESLKQRLSPGYQLELYLIHSGMTQDGIDLISSIVTTHSMLPSHLQLASMPYDSKFPREAAFPLLLAELLPESLERVLFLDADLLVMDDLSEIWEFPLDDCVVAAVTDSAVPLCSSPRGVKGWQGLGIPADAAYFNGGVLLIHLARWRQREITAKVDRYLKTTSEQIDFLHQEAMNAVLWNEWKSLDARWNLLASHAGRLHRRSASDSWRHPGIVHFAGRMKPWRSQVGGPFNEPYQEILRILSHLVAAKPSTIRDQMNSAYDRFFRAALYPLEQYMWRKRLI